MWSLWPNIRFLPSLVAEKNVTKNILEGRTDRGKTVYPPPPSGSGGIIRSKIGSRRVDLILIRLAKCWNNFFSSKFCIWLYCENVKSEYIFFSCPAKFFSSRFRIKIIFRKKNIKLKLNSLRGKLIKKNCKTKMVLPYTNKKRNKTVVIRKSHEKIFPSKIRLFFISLSWICANYFTYNELYFFFK